MNNPKEQYDALFMSYEESRRTFLDAVSDLKDKVRGLSLNELLTILEHRYDPSYQKHLSPFTSYFNPNPDVIMEEICEIAKNEIAFRLKRVSLRDEVYDFSFKNIVLRACSYAGITDDILNHISNMQFIETVSFSNAAMIYGFVHIAQSKIASSTWRRFDGHYPHHVLSDLIGCLPTFSDDIISMVDRNRKKKIKDSEFKSIEENFYLHMIDAMKCSNQNPYSQEWDRNDIKAYAKQNVNISIPTNSICELMEYCEHMFNRVCFDVVRKQVENAFQPTGTNARYENGRYHVFSISQNCPYCMRKIHAVHIYDKWCWWHDDYQSYRYCPSNKQLSFEMTNAELLRYDLARIDEHLCGCTDTQRNIAHPTCVIPKVPYVEPFDKSFDGEELVEPNFDNLELSDI